MNIDLALALAGVLIAMAVGILGYTTYVVFMSQRAKAQAKIIRRTLQTKEEATRGANLALQSLQGQFHRPIVLELINDITFDDTGRGAKKQVDIEAAIQILGSLKDAAENQPVEIVLHTVGGWSIAAEMIANAIKNRKGSTKAYVPYIAMSAGTMIAMACKEVHLGKDAFLGPVDGQLAGFPLSSFRRLKDEKRPENMDEEWLLLSYKAEKWRLDEVQKASNLINEEHKKFNNGSPMCRVVEELVAKEMSHDTLLGFKAVKDMGMNVKEGCPSAVYELVDQRIDAIRKHTPPAVVGAS